MQRVRIVSPTSPNVRALGVKVIGTSTTSLVRPYSRWGLAYYQINRPYYLFIPGPLPMRDRLRGGIGLRDGEEIPSAGRAKHEVGCGAGWIVERQVIHPELHVVGGRFQAEGRCREFRCQCATREIPAQRLDTNSLSMIVIGGLSTDFLNIRSS